MTDVAIIGAGEIGGALAHVLARREIVRRIHLIDASGQVAAGKALDIMQAGPIERFNTSVVGSTDLSRVAGCSVVVVADQAKPTPEGDALAVLRQIHRLAERAFVICAGVDGRTLVDRGVTELRYARDRLVGSAAEAWTASVRALVALEIDGSARDVMLTVVGAPPRNGVIGWDDASIRGAAAVEVLDEPTRRRLSEQAGAIWPPGPHALASAASDAVAGVCGGSRRSVCCFVVADDATGRRSRAVALPARLSPNGVTRIDQPRLSPAGRTALDTAMFV